MIFRNREPFPVTGLLLVLSFSVIFIFPVSATSIDPIADHVVGENITIGGSTMLPPGGRVWVDVSSSGFHPTSKDESIEQLSGEQKYSGTTIVTAGDGGSRENRWSVAFPTAGWEPGEYTVRASDHTLDRPMLWASGSFRLAHAPDAVAPSAVPATTISSQEPGKGSSTVPADSALPVPVLAIALGILAAGAGLYSRKRR